MTPRDKIFWIALLGVMLVLPVVRIGLYGLPAPAGAQLPPDRLPDFSRYDDIDAKKEAFFDFLQPFVTAANDRVLRQRAGLKELVDRAERRGGYTTSMRRRLHELAASYRVDVEDRSDEEIANMLLRRVDAVPVSLALTQAAKESAWGTSRFATEGNNLFGQWCYTAGCGLVPEDREAGRKHQVAAFDSPSESVASYIRNLNTHRAYADMRRMRQELREEGQPPTGIELAAALDSYSERGQPYVDEVRQMIRYNDLQQYDAPQ